MLVCGVQGLCDPVSGKYRKGKPQELYFNYKLRVLGRVVFLELFCQKVQTTDGCTTDYMLLANFLLFRLS